MDTPVSDIEITPEALRRALRLWGSTRRMGELPLAGLRIVQRRRLASGYSDTPAGHGLALREILQAAVLALRPEGGELDVSDRRWRPYFILSQQYFDNRAPEWVAAQLCISRRTYYNEQEAALEAVADALRRQEEQARTAGAGGAAPVEAGIGPGTTRSAPFLAPPRPVYPLVGRDEILATLKSRLFQGGAVALFGLPGVGKSSLAVELAHDPQVLAHFCDGVLWAGLGRAPDLPAQLTTWASALGLSAEVIRPSDLAASARALHAAIGMRRMLLVVDDAWDAAAALTFRLGGPHCAVLLTTRLAHVAFDFAGEGACQVHELDPAQGLRLLALVAPQAVEGDAEATASLVAAAGGLPLALILMGRHLRRMGLERRLNEALSELRQAKIRLELSQVQSPLERHPSLPADTPASLQTIIGLSEAALSEPARQALRALALFPPKPNTFSEAAALAVCEAQPEALAKLMDSGLIETASPGRLSLHQTISDYGRLQGIPPESSRRYAAYFARFALAHTSDHAALAAELDNLLAALELAEAHGWAAELIQLALALHPFLSKRGLFRLDERWLERAAALARQADDLPALSNCLAALGNVRMRLGQYPQAQSSLEAGLALARQCALPDVEADCLKSLGNADYYQGKYARAQEYLQQARTIFAQRRSRDGEARALNSLGLIAYEQGDYAEARRFMEQALQASLLNDDLEAQGVSLANLGLLSGDQGDFGNSLQRHQQALDIFRQIGNLRMEAGTLDNMGYVYTQLGNFSEAKACYDQALNIFQQIDSQQGAASALPFVAQLLHLLGDAPAAQARAREALRLAENLDDPYARGTALTVLGHALAELGRLDEAAQSYQQAVDGWRQSGQFNLASDPLSGLARLALQRGDPQTAARLVDEILAYLGEHSLDGALDPCLTYLTCLQVLQARRDPRLAEFSQWVQAHIMQQAACISDAQLRRSFLEKVPARRRLLAMCRGEETASEQPAQPQPD